MHNLLFLVCLCICVNEQRKNNNLWSQTNHFYYYYETLHSIILFSEVSTCSKYGTSLPHIILKPHQHPFLHSFSFLQLNRQDVSVYSHEDQQTEVCFLGSCTLHPTRRNTTLFSIRLECQAQVHPLVLWPVGGQTFLTSLAKFKVTGIRSRFKTLFSSCTTMAMFRWLSPSNTNTLTELLGLDQPVGLSMFIWKGSVEDLSWYYLNLFWWKFLDCKRFSGFDETKL